MALGVHIVMALEDRRVIAPTCRAQRLLARTVLTSSADRGLLAFRAADTHLHLCAVCCRLDAGPWARVLSRSLRCRLDLPVRFAPPHFEPIVDQRHLYNTHDYVLRQEERHGTRLDLAAEASNLPDLLGLRLLGQYTAANVARLLPRLRPEGLAARLGVRMEQLLVGPIAADALAQLADAAAAAVAIPALEGKTPDAVSARRAAVQVAGDLLSPRRLAVILGVSPRAVRRLAARPLDDALVTAVERQLRLRAALAGIS